MRGSEREAARAMLSARCAAVVSGLDEGIEAAEALAAQLRQRKGEVVKAHEEALRQLEPVPEPGQYQPSTNLKPW